MKTIIKKQKELDEAKIELIAWLNDECPSCFPPLEPFNTSDLSHDFAEKLRERLDNISIIKGQILEAEQENPFKDVYVDKSDPVRKKLNITKNGITRQYFKSSKNGMG